MTAFASTVAEVTRLAAVIAAAQTHAAALAGKPALLAELQERAVPIVVCVAVCAAANQLGAQVQGMLAGGATSAGESVALWRALAGFVTTTIVVAAGATLAAGLALGAFASQFAALSGDARALSEAWRRGLAVVATAALTALSVALANGLLALVFAGT